MPSDSESNSNPPKSPTVKKAAQDGDHRKKRRNRTTQSCLNCHFSKRMCNRKRPSCARCTQLGLSGLCVYEVDDPGQKQDPQDEHARLTTRVAELEAVIRELKKKPHPRWAWQEQQNGSEIQRRQQSGDELMDTLPDTREPTLVESPPSEDLPLGIPRAPSSSASSRPITPESCLPSPYPLYHTASGAYLTTPDLPLDALLQPFAFGGESPMSTPSDYFSPMGNMGLRIGDPMQSRGAFDLPSSCHTKDLNRCGCLHETGNHTLVLDLSMRLRKVADALTRSPCHCQGGMCLLTRRISDLDKYMVNSLERLTVLPEDASMLPADGPRLDNISMVGSGRPSRSNSWGQMNYTQHAQTVNLALLSTTSTSPDDAFMSWKPPR